MKDGHMIKKNQIKGKKKTKRGREAFSTEGREREERVNFFSSSLHFFLRSTESDSRFSLEQKAKSIHASRGMRGYQNFGVSSNSTR